MVLFALSMVLADFSAAEVPTKSYPLKIQKAYGASLDRAWDAVHQVINHYKGSIICSDKESGYVLYVVQDKGNKPRHYMNVYMAGGSSQTTIIYLMPYWWSGRSLEEVDNEFYDKLDTFIR
jgi:hypothetical protein